MSDPFPQHPRAGDPPDDQIISGAYKAERFGDRAFVTEVHPGYPTMTRIEIALDDFEAVKRGEMTVRQLARRVGRVQPMRVDFGWKLVVGSLAVAAALILFGLLTA